MLKLQTELYISMKVQMALTAYKVCVFGVFLVRMRENTYQKNFECRHFLHSG